jgi:hypothetical protein
LHQCQNVVVTANRLFKAVFEVNHLFC